MLYSGFARYLKSPQKNCLILEIEGGEIRPFFFWFDVIYNSRKSQCGRGIYGRPREMGIEPRGNGGTAEKVGPKEARENPLWAFIRAGCEVALHSGLPIPPRHKGASRKTSATDLRDCPFIVIFLAIIRPHAFHRNLLSGMRSNFFMKKEKTLENQVFSRVWWRQQDSNL